MSTENPSTPVAEATPEVPQEQQPSVHDYMKFAFQEQMPQDVVVPESEAQAVVEEPVTATPQPPTSEAEPAATIMDDSAYLKQHFGREDRETIKAILDEYEVLKAKASTPAEYQYASDEAKKLAHAINSGDFKTVKAYVEAQELNVEGMTADQQLKAYIRLQNPKFDDELIEDEYSSMYRVDETDDKYIDNPTLLRKDKLRAEQRKDNDLQNAQKYFSEYKQKAQLPDIKQVDPIVDQAYEQYKASTAKAAQVVDNVVIPSIKALKESDLGISLQINDPNNQMNFGVSVEVDTSDYQEAINSSINFGEFMDSFWKEDGSYDAKKLTKTILLAKNFDKYAQTIARQAVNAERKRLIEANTVPTSVQRNFNLPSEEATDPIHEHYKRAMAV